MIESVYQVEVHWYLVVSSANIRNSTIDEKLYISSTYMRNNWGLMVELCENMKIHGVTQPIQIWIYTV